VKASEVRAWPNQAGNTVALLAGMAMPLAFAPFQYYPVALLSVMLLFLSWDGVDAKQAAIRGFLFGLGLFGVGVSWIYVAIHEFGQASMLLAGLLTGLFVAFLALYLAALGWGIKKLTVKTTFTKLDYLFLLPVAWLFFDWFKGWFLTGFPWLDLGVSQIEGPLSGYIPVVGALGVSLIGALSAGLLASVWQFKQLSALLVLMVIWAGGAALNTIEWTYESDDPITVSLIQGNVPQGIKWDREQVLKTLSLYQTKTQEHWQSDLIVWPENAATVFYHQAKEVFFDPLAIEARENNTDILLGLPIYDDDGARYYNGMMSLGAETGFYHKRHLVPFGDYVPFEWLRGLIAFFDLPMSSFYPGEDSQVLLTAAGQKVGVSVCYEDAFSNEVLDTLPEASVLVNATNNAWYGDSFAPHQHLQISQNRALETGRPIIRSTTNGISALIDYRGALQATTAQFEMAVLTGKVQPRQGMTFYVQWQQWPLLILALFMLLVWAYYRRNDLNKQAG
jgi:apolipoprotein N-acyltransferase